MARKRKTATPAPVPEPVETAPAPEVVQVFHVEEAREIVEEATGARQAVTVRQGYALPPLPFGWRWVEQP